MKKELSNKKAVKPGEERRRGHMEDRSELLES